MAEKNKRFVKIYNDSSFFEGTEILVDRETGVHYLYHVNGFAGGLTVLLDENGNPVITKNI